MGTQSATSPDVEPPASRWIIAVLSLVAFVTVLVVTYGLPDRSGREATIGLLPSINAALNALAAAFLTMGYVFIRRRRIAAHKACMLAAVGVSIAFFVGYLLHHARVGSVPFQGQGTIRTVYFSILIPHIVLAAFVPPLALTTLYRGLTARYVKHRRVARWTLPIWWFVSASGVVVYFMLYHL